MDYANDDQKLREFLRLYTSHEIRLRACAISIIFNYADAEDALEEAKRRRRQAIVI